VWATNAGTDVLPSAAVFSGPPYGVSVGFAYGYRQAAGEWSCGADRPAPADVKAGPTFAVMERAVLPDHRGKGIGRALMDELLDSRTEPYAVLTVNPAAEARRLYERLDWRHIATRAGNSGGIDVMLLKLPTRTAP
jgi:ribosomal protein S18 acetylase RimI-like enzyme